jgi:hypothetical protein
MSGTLTRPNSNPILDMMRDGDTGDMFGLCMGYLGGIADVLYDADPNEIPAEWGYRPGIFGPVLPTNAQGRDCPYETVTVWEYAHGVTLTDPEGIVDGETLAYWDDPAFAERVAELKFAGRCLNRLIGWLDAAGKSY